MNFSSSEQMIDYAQRHGFGEFHVKIDAKTGMIAIIAIHSTTLGPALGGCRFISYPTTDAALEDALRLARGMSYKAALVHLPLGGGKAVIIKPNMSFDRAAYFDAFGRFVDEQNGRYITALDSGTTLEDMDIIGQHTPYVASLSTHGDPSLATAQGVLKGIHAAVYFQLGQSSTKGLHIAIQGLGHVGMKLAQLLYEEGAHLTVSDINIEAMHHAKNQYHAHIVSPEHIHKIPCDVFAPCALGAILNDQTIPELQTQIIAGAANNQLQHTQHGQQLFERGILYAPDYVINAGGLVYAAHQYFKTTESEYKQGLEPIYTSLCSIFEQSAKMKQSTSAIADHMAEAALLS